MKRYRLVVKGKPQPWRNTRKEAEEDAFRAGVASRETSRPGRIYLNAGAEIEEEG